MIESTLKNSNEGFPQRILCGTNKQNYWLEAILNALLSHGNDQYLQILRISSRLRF